MDWLFYRTVVTSMCILLLEIFNTFLMDNTSFRNYGIVINVKRQNHIRRGVRRWWSDGPSSESMC